MSKGVCRPGRANEDLLSNEARGSTVARSNDRVAGHQAVVAVDLPGPETEDLKTSARVADPLVADPPADPEAGDLAVADPVVVDLEAPGQAADDLKTSIEAAGVDQPLHLLRATKSPAGRSFTNQRKSLNLPGENGSRSKSGTFRSRNGRRRRRSTRCRNRSISWKSSQYPSLPRR